MEAVLTTSRLGVVICISFANSYYMHVHVLNKLLIQHPPIGFHMCGDKEAV